MRRFKRLKKVFTCSAMILVLSGLTGCSMERKNDLVEIPPKPYEGMEYPMAYVQKGDLIYDIEEEMVLDNYKERGYRLKEDEIMSSGYADVEFDELMVDIGDSVKKGDVLVKFKSKSLDDEIKQYVDQKELAEAKIRHLENRKSINPDEDIKKEVNSCNDSIIIAEAYLEELNAFKDKLIFKAEEDGVVMKVSDAAYSKNIDFVSDYVVVQSGDDTYKVETQVPVKIKEGQDIVATSAYMKLDATVTKVEKSAAGTVLYIKIKNNLEKKIIVKGLSAHIAKEIKKDVIYLPSVCVKNKDDKYYVFTLNDEGIRVAKEIQVGEVVGENIIIKEGLSEGEKVIAK
ncbi:Multidrug efflux pump subunit AcrA (membrane-fusion protein) [Eubacterium ruminantium]|uniref:Multidrug efflux pump subunit AcrA (Membrane-fusion protein) n=2 Tax=Eubacterium TaxID=1730 RepID=A0A1T4M224_9FIRM|nr:hypothetical protein [Eubacterium ruminantium]MCR5367439.1 hypothetical protein [Eubacterium sp.]SCW37706.1 Multidrug efflux pump subunit AcrA (membrane-fusion protein) [Eubacterium ruminantium]SDM46477.1 Multidrug efflux pump subunit AcrA (membrane-fusion protein) [Eubacterium ruminantium]SJZ60935.1 Multidrug efflux pump subunit AcrA (membrane-fusion protein) [Eubacterium ruminantium]